MATQNTETPRLQKLSWIAGIMSFSLAAVTWFVPSALRIRSIGTQGGPQLVATALRLLVFVLFMSMTAIALMLRYFRARQLFEVRLKLAGDWASLSPQAIALYIV